MNRVVFILALLTIGVLLARAQSTVTLLWDRAAGPDTNRVSS